MEIRKAIDKIRFRMSDTNEVKHSDYEIVLAINDGYRMFHDICLSDNPDLIAHYFGNRTVSCENVAQIPYAPSKIISVRCNGKIIHPARMSEILNTESTGSPQYYVPKMVNGRLCLLLFPRPQTCVSYSVDFVPELQELEVDDDLPVSNDVANCIIDYVIAALNGGETDSIGTKLQGLINGITPSPCVVESYY